MSPVKILWILLLMDTIDVMGHSSDYNGQVIPYYAAAIKAVSATANIDLMKYVSDLF